MVLEFCQVSARALAGGAPTSLTKILVDREEKLSNAARFSCGAFSRSFVGFIFMPVSVIKTRLEVNMARLLS